MLALLTLVKLLTGYVLQFQQLVHISVRPPPASLPIYEGKHDLPSQAGRGEPNKKEERILTSLDEGTRVEQTHATPNTTESIPITRRHDLDALRAVAMLLGIALHGMISFIPDAGAGWPVQDSQTSISFAIALAAIHGFRMQLFFLISGFFTMMLFRKRGLRSLLWHRFKRIFVPMVLSLLTIIPAMWAVGAYVGLQSDASQSLQSARDDGSGSAWIAAARGDVDRVRTWIDAGGDVHFREDDGSTALHGAFLFGEVETAELLTEAGADPSQTNHRGESASEMLSVPWPITEFVAGLVRIQVDREKVADGRAKIARSLGDPELTKATDGTGGDAKELLNLLHAPILGHLWFLWFLCLFVFAFAVCITVGRLLRIQKLPNWISTSAWKYVWIIPLTAIAQYVMPNDIDFFGPATTESFLPTLSVVAYYAVFFGFGAIYFDADHSRQPAGKLWHAMLLLSLIVVFPIGLATAESEGMGRIVSVVCQVVYAWMMTFGAIGMFRTLLSRESQSLRYVSDSSYWMYLIHLPVIFYAQYLVRDSGVSTYIKFAAVCFGSSFVLLVSYHVLVRYTPIGSLLNGQRRKLGWR